MATTTLTVQVDEQLLARAEELARARKMTVGEMIERLLRVISAPALSKQEMRPVTRNLAGVLPNMSDDEVRATIDEARDEKFGQ